MLGEVVTDRNPTTCKDLAIKKALEDGAALGFFKSWVIH